MSERELSQLFKRATRDLDQRQRARIRDLRGIERVVFEAIVRSIIQELGSGVISTETSPATINQLVDVVFNALDGGKDLNRFYQASTTDLFSILGNNDAYNAAVSFLSDDRFGVIRSEVDGIMRKRIGIDVRGRLKKGGLLDRMFDLTGVRTEVKEVLNAGVQAGTPMSKLVRELEVTVKGAKDSPGLFRKKFSPLVFDTYQGFDRASNDVYAQKLDLDAFIYVGGLIETSRRFCEKRDGEVFTRREASKWHLDRTLPRTRKERISGVVTGYYPLRDMGRWNCRHRTRFISPALAEQMRPGIYNEALQRVRRNAKESGPFLQAKAVRIAKRHGGTVTDINYKEEGSIVRKATNDYQGDYSKVGDAVRNTIIVPANGINGVIEDIENDPIHIRTKRRTANTDALGYSGTVINVRMPNGSMGEVQVNTAEMIYAKEIPERSIPIIGRQRYEAIRRSTGLEGGLGHEYYEEYRLPETSTERKIELERLSKEYYANFR